MKKCFSLLLLLIIIFLVGCDSANEKYSLEVDDPNNFIIEGLKEKYRPGEQITVKTCILIDAGLQLYLDDEFLCFPTPVTDGQFTHWEFKFTMPNKNTKISLKIKDVTGLLNKGERIIYFDSEISEILYEILFNYELTPETYDLHKEFVEKSGLKELDYAHIFYYKNSAYIFVYFAPDKDTSEVQEFMDGLKEKYDTIISLERKVYHYHRVIYMHNPAFYGLEENDKIPFELTEPFVLPKGIYKSIEDVEKALDAAFELKAYYWYSDFQKEEIKNSVRSIYNEEYFKNNILVVTDTITTGSGSNRQEVKEIYLKDNQLMIFVKMYFASTGTCDIQNTIFGIKIAKDNIRDLDNLDQILLYQNPDMTGLGLW